ncbi:hypothetical protein Bpfe_027550 [Biomphalaria pfeifferi]|uniref:Uncharacterized protein n=1 Tax=Biomphalaria pfeifferi TaxID=112525 RepID=A0AAD8EXS6_BIOPF|nr:hypothetical protein Bpfe_027550 [Biomphalaria pfeifferi]
MKIPSELSDTDENNVQYEGKNNEMEECRASSNVDLPIKAVNSQIKHTKRHVEVTRSLIDFDDDQVKESHDDESFVSESSDHQDQEAIQIQKPSDDLQTFKEAESSSDEDETNDQIQHVSVEPRTANETITELVSDEAQSMLNETIKSDEESTNYYAHNFRPLTSSTVQDLPGGLRAKPNTPASQNIFIKQDFRSGLSSQASDRLTQSMSTVRSSQSSWAYNWEEDIFTSQELRFGVQTPHYFYVNQNKPSPMPPLPVWRGYRGNVYFEPISITKLNYTPPQSAKEERSPQPSSKPYRLIHSSNQVYILDKQAVFSSINSRIRDEVKFIEGVRSTGSLAVRPASALPQPRNSRASSSRSVSNVKQKIRKGSNYHSSKPSRVGAHSAPLQSKQFYLGSSKSNNSATTLSNTADPKLVVNGGKLTSRTYVYTTARSPTVLSFSTQKARVNTPDLGGGFEKLPTLERVSSVDLDTQEEDNSFRSEIQSRASNYSEENRQTPRNYTPKVNVRHLSLK